MPTSRHALLSFALAASALGLQAGNEHTLLSLKKAAEIEVQAQGFSLAKPLKVHVYAKGGSVGPGPFFAYGWILNADTREVVWQMDGRTSKREGAFQVADAYLDLPKGNYEAYFTHHCYGQNHLFPRWTRNIDRRHPGEEEPSRRNPFHVFIHAFHGGGEAWRRRVGHYGLEVYVPAPETASAVAFPAPLAWKQELFSLLATEDGGRWTQAFRVKKPASLHLYAQGEAGGRHAMADRAWILDARTRKPVWELDELKAQYAGGAAKNRRQVETIQLPPGDYIATYVTDDSHSPADWNAAPPCDPLRYGLIVSAPKASDQASVEKIPLPDPGPVLAEIVRVGNHAERQAGFTLPASGKVRVYALGEGDDDELADTAWIEDEHGKRVWTMALDTTQHAGGAEKNRLADEVLTLPKGAYTLHVQTDGSHAYGHWNAAAPWDADRYGATVYAVK